MTPRVKQFRLRVEGHRFEYEPGWHTTVRFERDGEEVVRPYTPTSLPGTDEITLAIERYDDGTASVYVHEHEHGDEIELGEPEGISRCATSTPTPRSSPRGRASRR